MTTPINIEDTWDPRANDLITLTSPCTHCGGTTVIKASKFLHRKWVHGTTIQEAWPHVSAARREALITGYHARCFELMFKDDDA
jgi:hypothetical protein